MIHLRFPPLLSYKLTSIDHVMLSNMYPNTLFSLTLQYSYTHIRPLIRSGHSTYSGYPPILGIVTVGNRPDCTSVHIGTLAFPSLPCLAASLCASLPIIFRLPHPVIVPVIPPSPSSRPLRMSRLFPLLLGRFPSTLLLTILYYGVLCKLLGQFNGSLPQSIAVGCTHNCGHDQHLDLFTGSSLSEIEIEYLY